MPTPSERAAEKRREQLEEIKQQVEDGSLTIRQMTPEERKLYPPRTPTVRRK